MVHVEKKEKTRLITLALRPMLYDALIEACNTRGVRPTEMAKTLLSEWVFANTTKPSNKAAS
jgi:hypothetical protein